MAIHYQNNGGGRDSYIYSNNGGFTVKHSGSMFPKPGSMLQAKKMGPSVAMKFAPLNGKPVHYNNDGTGRDGYIFHNAGGFMSPSYKNPGKYTFFNQLRTYDASPMQRSNSNSSLGGNSPKPHQRRYDLDYFTQGQSIITNKQDIKKMKKLVMNQRD